MNINQSTPNFQAKMPAKKLIPMSSYKGPVLELTQGEQVQVKLMQDKIAAFTNEIANVKVEIKGKGKISTAYRNAYKEKIKGLQNQIENLNQSIRKIKVNRFNQQKQAFNLLG